MRTVLLNDGHGVDVPDRDYPWVQEWLWYFDAESGRVYRIENGRTVWLYHELLKRHQGDPDYITLDDAALTPMFARYAAYDEMAEKWMERLDAAHEASVLLPDPADILTGTLTAVLYLYFDWIAGGKWYEWTPSDLIIHQIGPEKKYGTLGEWLDSEWTGRFDGTPETFLDKAALAAHETLVRLLRDDNPGRDIDEVIEFFDSIKVPMDDVLAPILWLIKQYPTPE
jgi:hypothetical protein